MKGITPRERNLVRVGLKGLDKITYLERNGDGVRVYQCNICNDRVTKGKVVVHFINHHDQDYNTIKTLIHTWGLVDSGDMIGIEGRDNEREENIQIDISRLI